MWALLLRPPPPRITPMLTALVSILSQQTHNIILLYQMKYNTPAFCITTKHYTPVVMAPTPQT